LNTNYFICKRAAFKKKGASSSNRGAVGSGIS